MAKKKKKKKKKPPDRRKPKNELFGSFLGFRKVRKCPKNLVPDAGVPDYGIKEKGTRECLGRA
jgi:hypothetical protein